MDQLIHGASHADITKAALFLNIFRDEHCARVREESLLQPAEKHKRKLQTLGGMQAHQRDLGPRVIVVRIGNQGRMIEKLVQRFGTVARIHGGIDKFAQILDADRKSTRLNSSHVSESRMPSSA